jgi:hypothetical protein
MDSFLASVVRQRELEQEAELLAAPGSACVEAAPRCQNRCTYEGCGRELRRRNRSGICPRCRAVKSAREHGPRVVRNCQSCNKRLHPRNLSRTCNVCRVTRAPEPVPVSPRASIAPEVRSLTEALPVRERFRLVAASVGRDPDALVERFMAVWLSDIAGTPVRAC